MCIFFLKSTHAQSEIITARIPEVASFEPEEEMIFELRLDNKFLLDRSLFAYYRDEKIYLPLAEICRLIEFPIECDTRAGIAQGWFLSEERRFALDLTNKEVVSGKLRETLHDDDFYLMSDDIYLHSDCFTTWFPIKLEANIRTLVVNVLPLEPLPIMQRMERDSRWSRLRAPSSQARLPLEKSPYAIFTMPSADLSLSHTFSKNSRNRAPTRYSLALANDMLYHTSQLYLSGNEDSGLTAARLRLTWADQAEDQRAWTGYNTYSIGDMTPTPMTLIPSLRTGRGVFVSNTPLNYTSEFSATTISGNLPADWSAELYRGRTLIEVVAAENVRDEMYFFENVPVLMGNNDFIVKLYGPYGEIREEHHNLFVGSGMVSPRKTYYKLSVLQNNRDMLPVNRSAASIRPEGYTIRSEVTRGISERLSLKHDFAGIIEDDEEHLYSTIEAIGSIAKGSSLPAIHGSVGVVSQIDAGNALLLKSRSNVNGWSISNEYFNFDRSFAVATARRNADWRNTLNLSGRILDGQSLSLRWMHDAYRNDFRSDRLNLRLSSRVGQSFLLNTIDHRADRFGDKVSHSSSDGNTEIRTRVGRRGEISAGLNYLIKPTTEFRTVGIGGRWRDDSDTSYSAQLRRHLNYSSSIANKTYFNMGIMKEFADFSSGLQVSADSSGDYRAMVTLSSSFAMVPDTSTMQPSNESMVRTGGVAIRVVQRLQDTLVPLKDVEVIAGGRRSRTDEAGLAVIRGLTPARKVDVTIDTASLVDPFLVVASPGMSVIPRSGILQHLDYYVVMTSEIEGTVFYEKDGTRKPVGGIQLRLINVSSGEIVGRARTDGEGFYILDFIRPGSYMIDIDRKQAEALGVYVIDKAIISIGDEGDILTGQDVILREGADTLSFAAVSDSELEQLDVAPPVIHRLPPQAPRFVEALKTAKKAPEKVSAEINKADIRDLMTAPPAVARSTVEELPDVVRKIHSSLAGNMVWIPGGTFRRDANPANISLVSPFYMSEHELTFEQLAQIRPESNFLKAEVANLPADSISWYDALVICNKLSILEGLAPVYSIKGTTDPASWGAVPQNDNADWNAVYCDWRADGYRLPTEMEWMWAAMGADFNKPAQTNTIGFLKEFAGSGFGKNVEDHAWFWANSNENSHKVGTKAPNELGIHDMSGNISEWCWDTYQPYPDGFLANYRGAVSGARRVERGGSYLFGNSYLSVARRGSGEPFIRHSSYGLRLVRSSAREVETTTLVEKSPVSAPARTIETDKLTMPSRSERLVEAEKPIFQITFKPQRSVKPSKAIIKADVPSFDTIAERFAEKPTQATDYLTPEEIEDRDLELDMVFVPAGLFARDGNEANVSVVSEFYISRYEITAEQMAAVLKYSSSDRLDNLPASKVSWYEALVFCNNLSLLEGLTPAYSINGSTEPDDWGPVPGGNNVTWNAVVCNWSANGYRLPTEMEWMWAAMGAYTDKPGQANRQGHKKEFAGSDSENSIEDFAWFWTNANEQLQPVGSRKPNELDLYDMSGNVAEWCWDYYHQYPDGLLVDYRGPIDGSSRVERGGSYMFGNSYLRLSKRGYSEPFIKNQSYGFRVVRR